MDVNLLEERLEEIYAKLLQTERASRDFLHETNDEYLYSAQNLLYYLVLRSMDLREVQPSLIALGISSLGTSAGYVLENVSRTLELLKLIEGKKTHIDFQKPSIGHEESDALLDARSTTLFKTSGDRPRTKIMVTMPDEAATQPDLLMKLAFAGMDVARINLSHGDENLWNSILHNLNSTDRELQAKTAVLMDLPGPKIRVADILIPEENQAVYSMVNAVKINDGDRLLMVQESDDLSEEAVKGNQKAIVTVLLPEIIDDLEVGHRVFFDDGSIECLAISKSFGEALLQVVNTTKKN